MVAARSSAAGEPPQLAPWGVEDTLAVSDLTRLVAGPDGRLAVVRRHDEVDADRRVSELWLVDGKGARPCTAGPADDHPAWLDARRLVHVEDDGVPTLVLRDATAKAGATAGHASELARLPGGVRSVVAGGRGDRLAVIAIVQDDDVAPPQAPLVLAELPHRVDGVGLLAGRRARLLVVDASNGAVQQVDHDGHALAAVWDPVGDRLAWSAAVHERRGLDRRTDVFVGDPAGPPAHHVAPDGWSMTPVLWDRPDRILVSLTPYRPAGHTRLALLDPVDGRLQWLFDGLEHNVRTGDAGYPGARPFMFRGELVFAVRVGGSVQLWRGPLDGGPAAPLPAPEAIVVSAAVAVGDEGVAVVSRAPGRPAELRIVPGHDLTGGSPLTRLHDGLVSRRRWMDAQSRSWDVDGVEVKGWLRGRRDEGRQPLLVDLHGGPHNAWSPAFDASRLYQQELAAGGWLVLTLDPRGSDGRGEDFLRGLVGRGWGFADEQDVLVPIDDLVQRGLVDPGRVAVSGYSYGGYLGAWLVARHPDRFAAAVLGGLVSNLVSHGGASDIGPAYVLAERGRPLVDSLEQLWQSSPMAHLDRRIRPPTLLLQGLRDERCPFDQAEQFHTALRDIGGVAELVAYPGASHQFVLDGRPSHRRDWQRRLVDWVRRHAEGVTSPSERSPSVRSP